MGSTATADIARMLGSIHDRDHYTVLRDFFELSAISIRNAVDFGRDRDTYEMRYKAIAEKYRKEYLEIIAQAFAMLVAQILKAANGDVPFADWAGEIYMDSRATKISATRSAKSQGAISRNRKLHNHTTPKKRSRKMAERTTITIDRDLLIEAQRTAARKGVPMGVAGSTSKFIRFLLQDYCARNPALRNG